MNKIKFSGDGGHSTPSAEPVAPGPQNLFSGSVTEMLFFANWKAVQSPLIPSPATLKRGLLVFQFSGTSWSNLSIIFSVVIPSASA